MKNSIRVIPPAARCLSPRSAAARYDRSISWLWARLKTDPTFPKPIYLGAHAPVFIEAEIDQHIASLPQKVIATLEPT